MQRLNVRFKVKDWCSVYPVRDLVCIFMTTLFFAGSPVGGLTRINFARRESCRNTWPGVDNGVG